MKGISIIVPTFNRENYISETIESILNQDYKGYKEIIISDDGSTDETLRIAKNFGEQVIILEKPNNCTDQGASATRNRGIQVATQDYLCFLDSDDYYLPDHLNSMVTALDNNPSLYFAFCRTLEMKEELNIRLFREWTHRNVNKNDILHPVVSRSNIVNTNCFMFRRIVFETLGGFNAGFSNGEDGDMWMRISEQYKGLFVDHFGVVYRSQHGKNQLTYNSMKIIDETFIKIYENAIQRYYQLKLSDQFRIFALKHRVSFLKHKKRKILHYLNFILLILLYPVPFLRKYSAIFHKSRNKKNNMEWFTLDHFINLT